MSKPVKELIISELQARIGDHRDMLVLNASAMDAFAVNQLRLKLREKGIFILSVKNALARKALGNLGLKGLDDVLVGPSSLAFGGPDAVALSKEMTQWAKQITELEIKGGAVEGTPLDAKGVEALSKSPGREELIGRVLMLIRSPGATVAGALLGPGGKVAGQLKTLGEESGETAEEPAAS